MSAEDRKLSILHAARPLFAAYGFNGTSMRQIAKAADVSLALLYRHFPSKESMYKEMLSYVTTLSVDTVRELKNLEKGSETLALLIYTAFQIILFAVPGKEEQQKMHERFLFYSLIEDAAYARIVFDNLSEHLREIVLENYEAAFQAGDVVKLGENTSNFFWFVHHLAMALNLCHITGAPAFQYDGNKDELMADAVLFCLRGIGMTNKAIEQYYKPNRMKIFIRGLFG
jgi:AcrR family transcriptional regulator